MQSFAPRRTGKNISAKLTPLEQRSVPPLGREANAANRSTLQAGCPRPRAIHFWSSGNSSSMWFSCNHARTSVRSSRVNSINSSASFLVAPPA